MHLLLDLDRTLLDTSELTPYMRTQEGRRYIVNNPDNVYTSEYDSYLKNIVKSLHRKNKITVVTNSPADYAKALLKKHGFPSDLSIIANSSKPNSVKIKNQLRRNHRQEDILIVGDHPVDILTGHYLKVCSAAALWGTEFPETKLKKAEPAKLLDDVGELEQLIIEFEKGNIEYVPRGDVNNYKFADFMFVCEHNELNCLYHVDDYIPVNLGERLNDLSKKILLLKRARDVSFDMIKSGACDTFFYNNYVRKSEAYMNGLKYAIRSLSNQLILAGIEGSTLLIPAPNSLPDFCYLTDVNHLIVKNVIRRWDNDEANISLYDYRGRFIYRVIPVNASHKQGGRGVFNHYRTIGIKQGSLSLLKIVDNVLVYDDVTTSGSMLNAIATIIRQHGFNGKVYGVVLGKTIS